MTDNAESDENWKTTDWLLVTLRSTETPKPSHCTATEKATQIFCKPLEKMDELARNEGKTSDQELSGSTNLGR